MAIKQQEMMITREKLLYKAFPPKWRQDNLPLRRDRSFSRTFSKNGSTASDSYAR